ncbi:MAG: hypothetical protein KKD44_20260 [Proteobacteria bacterium]|nr:hypothetical protein [Pseudomonadota bacterium]
MTQALTYLFIVLSIISIIPDTGCCLEALSNQQMKKTMAQAGIDIAIGDMITEVHSDNMTFYNPDDETEYISFNDIHILTHTNTGSSDMDDDGKINHLSIDVGTYNDQIMFFSQSPDISISTDMTIDAIDFSGTNIGSLTAESMVLSSFHLFIGPHVGSMGIDYELGHKITIDTLSYKYNTTDALNFSGITFDIQVGDLTNNKPATIDISAESNAHISLNMPMSGSFHIDNIQVNAPDSGTTDLGLFAIDGMNVQKLYIEIPGRGLGNP